MDTTPSNTTDQETLRHQMEAMGVESTTSITTLGADTPIERDDLKRETLLLPNQTADSLGCTQYKRLETTEKSNSSPDTIIKSNGTQYICIKGISMGTTLTPYYVHLLMEKYFQHHIVQ